MENMLIFSVIEVTRHLRQVLESTIEPLYIKGEVSNFVHHSSGHMYFNLKDDYATLRCTFFKNANYKLSFRPKDGDSVICFGRITLYEKGGTYNLNVSTMIPAGLGEIQARIEALKKKLDAEGLFAKERKKALPRFPEKIGIVTSPTGAALQDISNILKRRYPIDAYVYPALVQGNDAPPTLIKGIQYFNECMKVDLIILTRGGGSQEDLFCFNDEALARAIFASKVPIISAVGHEIDFSISDFVADLRAPTPSAAAEIAVPNKEDLLQHLGSLKHRIKLSLDSQIAFNRRQLSDSTLKLNRYHPEKLWQDMQQRFDMASLALTNIVHFIKEPKQRLERSKMGLNSALNIRILGFSQRKRQELNSLKYQLNSLSENMLKQYKQILSSKEQLLSSLSPDGMLRKGWALPIKDGKVIKSVKELSITDEIDLKLSDGEAIVAVKDLK